MTKLRNKAKPAKVSESRTSALLCCHSCNVERDCYFPFKPLRPGRCNGDKFWTKEKRSQYDTDIKEEREAAIRSEIRPPWSNET